LSRLWRRPWIADFRDPWARGPWRDDRPALARSAAASLERLVVSRADAVLFTTRRLRDDVVAHGPAGLAARCHVVPNGCDPAEFDALAAAPPDDAFTLAHVGTLYGGRNPVPLLQAVASLRQRGGIDAASFRLRLIGPAALPGVDLAERAGALGIADLVEIVPAMSRRDSLAAMRAASALVLLQPGHRLSVPAKTFEYLAAGRPVLALTGEGATADLVRASGCGVVVAPDDPAAIEAAVAGLVRARGTPPPPVDPHWFDARPRAAEMAAIVDAVRCARAPRVRERLA
jgi:glycosyltransferase involved in cell wall biosynthesis